MSDDGSAKKDLRTKLIEFGSEIVLNLDPVMIATKIKEQMNAKTVTRVKRSEADKEKMAEKVKGGGKARIGDFDIIEDMPDYYAQSNGVKHGLDIYKHVCAQLVGPKPKLDEPDKNETPEQRAERARKQLEDSPAFLAQMIQMLVPAAMKSEEGRALLMEKIQEDE